MLHRNYGSVSIVSEVNGDFVRKSQIFPTPASYPRVFNAPPEWVALGICNGGGAANTRLVRLPEGSKRLSTVCIHLDIHVMPQRDRQTDRHRYCLLHAKAREKKTKTRT